MHNLLLFNLSVLVILSLIFSLTGSLQFGAVSLLASAVIFTSVCVGLSFLLAKFYGATLTVGSSGITGLILFCIFTPPKDVNDAIILALVGAIAIASRYLLARNRRHIFNPAAMAAVIIGLLGIVHASWWIANDAMAPFVLLLGLLIIRKLRRWALFGSFFVVATALTLMTNADTATSMTALLKDTLVSWPILFLGLFMLTEPLTTPPRHRQQIIYGALVGALVGSPHIHVGSVFLTPEVALVIGNLYAYSTTMRQRLSLRLQSKKEVAPGIYEFVFRPNARQEFTAGQYAEVTLSVPLLKLDVRGNHRSFTVASSPDRKDMKIVTRFPEPASSFKQELKALQKGKAVYVNYIGGEFVLPKNPVEKLVFVAGGIGVTPFVSMVESLLDTNEKRDIVLFYQVANKNQLLYPELWQKAEKIGLKLVPIVNGKQFDAELLRKHIPDFSDHQIYVSGPPGFVAHQESELRIAGVKRAQIVTDYFSGY